MAFAIVAGLIVLVLAASGNWWLAIPLIFVGAIVANRMGRQQR